MTLDDIMGVGRCLGRKSSGEWTDQAVCHWLWREHTEAWNGLLLRRPFGDRLMIVQPERPRERAMRMDDGKMSMFELSVIAQCGVATAYRARQERESRG